MYNYCYYYYYSIAEMIDDNFHRFQNYRELEIISEWASLDEKRDV